MQKIIRGNRAMMNEITRGVKDNPDLKPMDIYLAGQAIGELMSENIRIGHTKRYYLKNPKINN